MGDVSNQINVSVVAIPSGITLVGTNTEQSVRPAAFSGGSGGTWQYTLFDAFGSGCFVPGWSTHGCLAICGTGGHLAPENVDCCIFDFADYTWKYLPNTNGVAPHPAPYVVGDTTGSPYWMITGSTVPCPGHIYSMQVGVDSSVYWIKTYYQTATLAGETDYTFRCALNYDIGGNHTCTWTRFSSNTTVDVVPTFGSEASGNEAYTRPIYDSLRNRIWGMTVKTHAVFGVPYLDLDGGNTAWVGTTLSTSVGGADSVGTIIGYDPVRDRIWLVNFSGQLVYVQLGDTSVTGYTTASSTNSSLALAFSPNSRWCFYPASDGGDDCFYKMAANGGNQLVRFDPATRAFSTVTISTGTMPSYPAASGDGVYGRFCYVPARLSLAWVAGNSQQVAIVRP